MVVNFELADEEPRMTADNDEILDLLQRRDAVQGWLEKLEEQRLTATTKVLEKVRADYEARLRATLEALAAHRDAIARELASAEERHRAAEAGRAEAGDLLEEASLRHRIGELAEEEWAEQRERLEAAAEEARQAESDAAADVARLRDLLEQLDARQEPAQPEGEPDEVTITPGPTAALEIPQEAFLAQIDRALTEETALDADLDPDAELGEDDEEGDTAPKPGLKCPECGYTNDISAWFCGVCGADIG